MSMRISIVGPGALGCLFAVKLQNTGNTVTLIDHDRDRAQRLLENGISLETDDGTESASIKTATSVPGRQNLIVILCKAYATEGLILPSGEPVLTLQNGLGNAEKLCRLVGSENVLAGTTSEASTLLEEGRPRHVASGTTKFGGWTTADPEVPAQVLRDAGFNVEITQSPGQAIWEKTVMSNGINPLTSLLNVHNGGLIKIVQARQLLRDLVVEASKVAALEGYRFDYSLVERAEQICSDTAENVSSMLQDVRAGRRTEIEEICGEVIARGETMSMPCPRTRVVYQLIRSIEQA